MPLSTDIGSQSEYTRSSSSQGVAIPKAKKLSAMAEFLCRANYGMRNGNFELGCDDGQIRYKSFVDCSGGVPSEQVIENTIIAGIEMMKRYSPGIQDVLFREVSPKKAVEKCEK